jgi:hypothetical protein
VQEGHARRTQYILQQRRALEQQVVLANPGGDWVDLGSEGAYGRTLFTRVAAASGRGELTLGRSIGGAMRTQGARSLFSNLNDGLLAVASMDASGQPTDLHFLTAADLVRRGSLTSGGARSGTGVHIRCLQQHKLPSNAAHDSEALRRCLLERALPWQVQDMLLHLDSALATIIKHALAMRAQQAGCDALATRMVDEGFFEASQGRGSGLHCWPL